MRAGRAKTVIGGIASIEVLGPSQSRIGIIWIPHPANLVTVLAEPSVVIRQGYNLNQGQLPFVMMESDYGDQVHQPWQAIASLAGTELTMIELFP